MALSLRWCVSTNKGIRYVTTLPVTESNAVTLTLANSFAVPPQTQNGSYDFPIILQNPDGSAPSSSVDLPAVTTAATISVNTGANTNWPVGSYPYVGHVASVGAGTSNVTISADGQPDVIMPFVVVDPNFQVAVVDESKGVVNAPQ